MDRFFVKKQNINLDTNSCIIEGEDVKHISKVLRCKIGEELEICSLFTGEIMEVNDVLLEEPQSIKDSMKDIDWIYKISIIHKEELDELITEEEYQEYLDMI